MSVINDKLNNLSKSKFRNSFHLRKYMIEYINEKGYNIRASKFVDYYTSNGWKVGKNPMKDWKAAVRTWERNSWTEEEYQKEREYSDLPY